MLLAAVLLGAIGLLMLSREQASPLQDQLADEKPAPMQDQAAPQTASPSVILTRMGCFILVALTLAAGAAWALNMTLDRLQQSRAAAAWPTAPGAIMSSTVKVTEHWDDEEDQKVYYYQAEVTYTYTAEGVPYPGNRVGFADPGISGVRGGVDALVARYSAGQAVVVHYNPANPSEAVLEVGDTGGVLWPFWLAVGAVVGVAVVIVWRLWTGFRRSSA